MTESAGKVTKTPDVGYISGDWDTSETKKLKDIFKAETEFTFNFKKDKDIVEKTDDPNQEIPKGYVKVTFKTDGNGTVNGKDVIIYYVNPDAGIKLGKTAGDKILVVPTPTANANYVFNGWQEAIDENNPITSEKVHVAMFQSGQVTLTYEKGGEDVTGELPANVSVNVGTTVGLAGPGNLKKPNASFAGWKLDEDDKIYQAGEQVKLEKARTATAQWATDKHKVEFDTDGGEPVPDTQLVEHEGKAEKPATDPTKDKFVFTGWKDKTASGETDPLFDFVNTSIVKDIILLAQWTNAVQKITDTDTIDTEKFIKVTFEQGKHGTLKGDTVYKVAKNLSFEEAVRAGLEVPEIIANKYYKAKAENDGWDKELALKGQDITFTAQYELKDNVVPVDPGKTNDELLDEKPEDMVLVVFEVDETKAYMLGDTKFYVKKSEVVNIPSPVVLQKDPSYIFKGWVDVTTQGSAVVQKFDANLTTIKDTDNTELKLIIDVPEAGKNIVYIKELLGTKGVLEVISGGTTKTYNNMTYRRRRQEFNVFRLDEVLKVGDVLRYWAEGNDKKSLPLIDTVK